MTNFNIIQFINAIPLKEHAGGGNKQWAELVDEGASEFQDQTRAGVGSIGASSRRTSPAREVS